MAVPSFDMRQLLEAGVHFGHQSHRWNPKMDQYIFGSRNNIHIIDLAQTVPMLHQALQAVSDTVARGGRVLFVGTKRAASDAIADSANRCAQYYINHRWLGGTLTNWKTITQSIKRLKKLDELLSGEAQGLTKKERLQMTRERDRLNQAIGGVKDMGGIPDILFVIDTNKEAIAIAEANKLNIPVIAVVDSNSNPSGITFPIPGNDDAGRAISLYCDLIVKSVLDGIERSQGASGMDLGASEEVVEQAITEEEVSSEAAAAAPASVDLKGFQGLEAPEGEADDLKKIDGVGPVIEKKLNELGIYHFKQIATLSKEQADAIDEAIAFKGRIERDDWLGQATKLQEA
jgi:small subunit ribosomal protein S2